MQEKSMQNQGKTFLLIFVEIYNFADGILSLISYKGYMRNDQGMAN